MSRRAGDVRRVPSMGTTLPGEGIDRRIITGRRFATSEVFAGFGTGLRQRYGLPRLSRNGRIGKSGKRISSRLQCVYPERPVADWEILGAVFLADDGGCCRGPDAGDVGRFVVPSKLHLH